ncbi:meiosis protein MEI2 [Aspergillus vadensis CBS 113365]|uniref:Meiosis protein MEI2 n=1 Tax=Aspergillus vadensis (strain CBS 113365 / IMI 142717 / IBT 24658) TaxID=1448311 RepID=A0A319B2Q6_ASPVC|nr:meiosis protein MEI2 [Aspergillus vadensis CBS 113365]PYH66051.1 meiosis protein MEI2 [Aspergillus vadensis CBS 113365]
MRPNDTSHGLSSPVSTNDIGSANGSPDTKLTAYSPEDMRSTCLRSDSNVGDPLGDTGKRKLYLTSSSDPFLVSTNTSTRIQLSPTAASFTPIGTADNVLFRSKEPSLSRGFSGVGYLTASSDIDPCEARNGPLQASDRYPLNYGVIGNSPADTRNRPNFMDYRTFGNESHSRALVIENVPKNLTYMSLAGFFNRREFSSLRGPVLSELNSMGKVYVAFTDSREATKAIEKVKVLRPEWHISTIAPKEYVKHVEPSLLPQTSNYEGQLLVTVYYDGRNPNLNQHTVARSLETLSMTFGDIRSFTPLPTEQENIGEFHIEYFNTRDAENVLTTLNGTSVDDCILDISLFRPDIEERKCELPFTAETSSREEFPPAEEASFTKSTSWTSIRPGRASFMELSPTGRSTVPPGERASLIDWMSKAGERIFPSPRRELSRYPDLRMGSQNAVDIERIRLGLDVRTTIMLRNIPNKIDQAMLKAIVDETSHGKYDFMYLRIDFANNCNVGYAFINFEDPIDIIDFINARAGRTWNCFNSDKVAEVSYATIQGKDCLVQKFRNSSVMLEHPSFRPKISQTGTGPLAGTEDRFPGPDNPSKMRRSIENAEHVGLFAPRVGQQYRDEQRRRRSQFDRGTTAAEREVVYVRTAFSAVVADGQFSTLGTVLIATLARLAKATGIDKELRLSSQTEKALTGPIYGTDAQRREDMGVILCRPEGSSTPTLLSGTQVPEVSRRAHDEVSLKAPESTVGSKKKSMRKKKRKKDAIDDLFDSLL